MKRLAVFVEGQTEMIFVKKLLEEVAGQKNIQFQLERADGRPDTRLLRMTGSPAGVSPTVFAMIFDCQNDEKVKSAIVDRLDLLTKAGYSLVLGLRDLYPRPLADLQKVKQGLTTGVPTAGIPVQIFLAVSEVEAWFIAEYTHFQRIDQALTLAKVTADLGLDLLTCDVELVPHPSRVLHQIYNLVGLGYKKSHSHVHRTVEALDFAQFYVHTRAAVPHLKAFVSRIDRFLDN